MLYKVLCKITGANWLGGKLKDKIGTVMPEFLGCSEFWGLAGAGLLGYTGYWLLYSRSPKGLYDRANALKLVAEKFPLVDKGFDTFDELKAYLNDGNAKKKALLAGNYYYFHIKEALDWVYGQGIIALDMLERAKSHVNDASLKKEIKDLYSIIDTYTVNAGKNKNIFDPNGDGYVSYHSHKQEYDIAIKQGQKEKELNIKQEMANAHKSATRLAWIAWLEHIISKFNIFNWLVKKATV